MKTYSEGPHKCFRYGFRLAPELRRDGAVLLDVPGVCRAEVRQIGSAIDLLDFEEKENYEGRVLDGCDLALEAEIELFSGLHRDWRRLRIGIPLSEVPGVEDFELRYTGPRFQLLGGGRVLDEEYPFGDPPGDPAPENRWTPVFKPDQPVTRTMPLHFWHPEGLDEWAGDVAVGYFKGEFHLFYLRGRRHHGSSFGMGSHIWAHFASRDLKKWRDDGDILPHQAQYLSYGTGTPFMRDGKIVLGYGLHTERYLPEGTAPRGGTTAESVDGCHFVPTGEIFTESRNPSVYNAPDGGFYFWAGYTCKWIGLARADVWPDFHPAGTGRIWLDEGAPTWHTAECPAYFEWHGRHFLLLGFSGMYSSNTPDFRERRDLAAEGLDVYDGLQVPMVASFAGDRRILAGWLRIGGKWGGTLGLRELVWCEDGIPGIRWLEEAMPDYGKPHPAEKAMDTAENILLDMTVQPGEDLKITLSGEGTPAELRIHWQERKAELVLASVASYPAKKIFPRYAPPGGEAAAHLRGLEKPYRVQLMTVTDRKLNGTIADVEIAGLRTLIHHFPGLTVRHAEISGPAEKILLSELKK